MPNQPYISEILVDYAIDIFNQGCPPEVEKTVTNTLIEKLGLELGGATFPLGKSMYQFMRNFSKEGGASILYYGDKVIPGLAAMVNATFGHMNDYDDTSTDAIVHPAGAVIAAAFAMGEHVLATGEDIFRTVYIGIEIMIRLGISVRDAHLQGFYTPTVVGPFAVAIVAGLLLKLNREQLVNAFAIAGSFCGGIEQFAERGGTVKRTLLGIAAKHGIEACYFALEGFTGPIDIIEGGHGLTSFSKNPNLPAITNGLGKTYYINNLLHKAYNCCHTISTPIESVIRLVKKHALTPENIKEIRVGLSQFAYDHTSGITVPTDALSAQFCVNFVLAMTILKSPPHLHSYTDEVLRDEQILDLAKRVTLYEEKAFNTDNSLIFASEVTITKQDDSVYSVKILHPKGSPENPLSEEEIKQKFYSCLNDDFFQNKEVIYDKVCDIRHYENITGLVQHLVL